LTGFLFESKKQLIIWKLFQSTNGYLPQKIYSMSSPMLGLRTLIYNVKDLESAKAWYTEAFESSPYFDEPFYVGFNIGGFELGLDPNGHTEKQTASNSTVYWGVEDIYREYGRLLGLGAKEINPKNS